MSVGISMVVKNEMKNIDRCLSSIRVAVDEIIIVDTGSTDGTDEYLRSQLGAKVVNVAPPAEDPHVITEARNLSLANNPCDWVLILDADEQISTSAIGKIKALMRGDDQAYFLTWRNARNGTFFDDYKFAMFRRDLGLHYEGMVHCNPTRSARRLGINATLVPDVVINHSLDGTNGFRSARSERLERHSRHDPTWWRYQWFLGYTYFKAGDFERAVPLLRDTCNSLSRDFPVECLNAHIVLTDLNARKGMHDKCARIMRQAASFYDEMKNDFEVKANLQMGTWITNAAELIDQNRLEEVKSYEFAY